MHGLLSFWRALPGSRAREDVDPVDLGPKLLRHVSIGHVIEGGRCIRYDLVGDRLKTIAPRIVPGTQSSDPMAIEGTSEDLVHDTLCDIARSQKPRVIFLEFRSIEGIHRQVFEVILPLGVSEEAVACCDLLIGVWDLQPDGIWIADRCVDLTASFLNSLSQDQ